MGSLLASDPSLSSSVVHISLQLSDDHIVVRRQLFCIFMRLVALELPGFKPLALSGLAKCVKQCCCPCPWSSSWSVLRDRFLVHDLGVEGHVLDPGLRLASKSLKGLERWSMQYQVVSFYVRALGSYGWQFIGNFNVKFNEELMWNINLMKHCILKCFCTTMHCLCLQFN